jgi:hypothetical protein
VAYFLGGEQMKVPFYLGSVMTSANCQIWIQADANADASAAQVEGVLGEGAKNGWYLGLGAWMHSSTFQFTRICHGRKDN